MPASRMQEFYRVLTGRPGVWIAPLAVFAAAMLAGYLVRRLFLRTLRAWASKAQNRPGMLLAEALPGPTLIWVFIFAAHVAVDVSELPGNWAQPVAKGLIALWILSLTLMSMRVAGNIVRHYSSQFAGAMPVTTLAQNLTALAILILGVVLILTTFGFDIRALLTALGVGGLAVALALQDTLSNLFAGFYIAVAGQIRMGDYIKLNTGEEGYVADITWRSTAIRSLNNNLIFVPNATLAKAIVTNFHLPEKNMSASVQVNVSYDSEPAQVERALLDVGIAGTKEIPGMLAEPAPSVSFDPGFADSSLAFTLNFHVAEFANQFAVKQELRKRVLSRFRQEGISIPYPTRTLHLASSTGSGPVTPGASTAQP